VRRTPAMKRILSALRYLYGVYCLLTLAIAWQLGAAVVQSGTHLRWGVVLTYALAIAASIPGWKAFLREVFRHWGTLHPLIIKTIIITALVAAVTNGSRNHLPAPLPSLLGVIAPIAGVAFVLAILPGVTVYSRLGRWWSAREIYLAHWLEKRGRIDAALAALERQLRRYPGNRQAIFLRSQMLLKHERAIDALAELRRVPAAHPDIGVLALRASTLQSMAAFDESAADYAMVLQYEPRFPRAPLIVALLNSGHPEEALKEIEADASPATESKTVEHAVYRAEALSLTGDEAAAREEWERALTVAKEQPENPTIRLCIIEALHRLGRIPEAREELRKLDGSLADLLSVFLDLSDGRQEEAAATARRLLTARGGWALARLFQDAKVRRLAEGAPAMADVYSAVSMMRDAALDRARVVLADWPRWPVPVLE